MIDGTKILLLAKYNPEALQELLQGDIEGDTMAPMSAYGYSNPTPQIELQKAMEGIPGFVLALLKKKHQQDRGHE